MNITTATSSQQYVTSLPTHIRKVAILGAGVMGSQIAAHFVNANLETWLFELPSEGNNPNADIDKAIQRLTKLNPAPLSRRDRAQYIHAANYADHLAQLKDCDLVIEAIAEVPKLKVKLYQQIVPHLNNHAILATNTSGLSVNGLAEILPLNLQQRFCGLHFFNPPRYMALLELIPSHHSAPELLDLLESFVVTTLGKHVIRAKDTPGFIANRLGVFAMLATLHHAERFRLPFDVVDSLTGKLIGRAHTATFRTMDMVGLDTVCHVINGSALMLKGDPWQAYYRVPDWLQQLVAQGHLGQKTHCGIYHKTAAGVQVLDPKNGQYRAVDKSLPAEIQAIFAEPDLGQRFAALRSSDHPHAQFLWAIHRDVLHHAAVLLGEIADNARDVDTALRYGFGWQQGVFELWQAAGWQPVAELLAADIAQQRTMAAVPLPAWVQEVDGVHSAAGSWSVADSSYHPRSQLPVYARQACPPRLYGELSPDMGRTIFDNGAVRLWQQGDDIAVLSFMHKLHLIGDDTLDGILHALDIAEHGFKGMVIWHAEPPFSAGANLAQVAPLLQARRFDALARVVEKFQLMTTRLRDAQIPVVAAAQGLAIGGGCEVLMHCSRVVAALETYVGLVETGLGLIPAGGGCRELARRASVAQPDGDVFRVLRPLFEKVGRAEVASSAHEAQQWGLLQASDVVIANPHELLHVAKVQANALAESHYRPALARRIQVAGRDGIANFNYALTNLREGQFISAHDYRVGLALATVLCGGDVDAGTWVDEAWLLRLERDTFIELLQTEKTQLRIQHMLKTHKPLRN